MPEYATGGIIDADAVEAILSETFSDCCIYYSPHWQAARRTYLKLLEGS